MKDGRKSLTRYSVAIVCAAIAALMILWLKDFGSAETLFERFKLLSDAFAVPGVLMIMVCALIWAGTQGIFDGLGYAFSRFGSMLIPAFKKAYEHETYYDYKMKKEGKRASGYSFLFFVGLAYFVVGIVFAILYECTFVPS